MNNVALITGASSGIGKALAYEHAKHGGDLVLVARREQLLSEIKSDLENKYSVQVQIMCVDLSDREAVNGLVHKLESFEYNIDILINNAGFGGLGKYAERNWTDDQSMIDVNINALAALTRFCLPQMIARNTGKIMNVASVASYMPGPLQATYYATKAFVRSLSHAISEELRGTNVTITTLCPGPTKSEFGKLSKMDRTKLFDYPELAEDVARKGYNAMLKGKRNVITDYKQKIMVALLPFMPNSLVLRLTRKLQEIPFD